MNIRWARRNILGLGIGFLQYSSLFTPVISVSLTQLNGLQTSVECFVRTRKNNSFWPANLIWIGVHVSNSFASFMYHELGKVRTRPDHKNLFMEFPKMPGSYMSHFDR